MTDIVKLRVLELYSGIGGMHCALQESGIPYEVVASIDINTTANKIYRHNFKGTYLMESGIETLTVTQVDRMKIDMILMSPPCQPFTRVGKKRDNEDIRTKSFLHLLDLLPQLTNCPSYILVENVKGFEQSQTREILVKSLQKCHFKIQEYMLTPLQFGIPNSRLRYYMLAKRQPQNQSFPWPDISEIIYDVPSSAEPFLKYRTLCDEEKNCYHAKKGIIQDVKIASSLTVDDDKSFQNQENEPDSKQDIKESSSDEDSGNEETICQNSNEKVIVTLCTDNQDTTDEQDAIHESAFAKRLKTKHNSDTEQDVKHSDDEVLDEETTCQNLNQEEWVNLCTDNKVSTDVQDTSHESAFSKTFKTKHNIDTEQDIKHSDDEDLQIGCCLCDNDNALSKEGQLMRQDDDTDISESKCLRLHNFLEQESSKYFDQYKVPDKDLRRFIVMDVVIPCLRKTICFTKRYGHYMEGAGSIIQMSTEVEDVRKARDLKIEAINEKNNKSWGEREIDIIRGLQLRYFTPREIANLLCFPETYSFPDDVSTIQKYRVLGNSLNVHVVSVLIHLLTLK